jgi:hypothetical protein
LIAEWLGIITGEITGGLVKKQNLWLLVGGLFSRSSSLGVVEYFVEAGKATAVFLFSQNKVVLRN